ncbi:unnamed protein product [Rotaria sordida]|uniref:Uncharacterized protein n=1 Tax=Rotaria sordida TaxID=392033 RepID=A0A819NI78_9BILA|nr:unnamed protein product [Rotaria sordida]
MDFADGEAKHETLCLKFKSSDTAKRFVKQFNEAKQATIKAHTRAYRKQVLPLLRRMSYLEELTLYIHILNGPTFISGTRIDNEILRHMSRLHMFTFYMACEKYIDNPTIRISKSDIERTFTDIKHRSVACMIDYFDSIKMISRVFSLPFKFDRLKHIGNNIPNIQFNFVSYLTLWDPKPYKHKFFVRLARAFPILKYLLVWNIELPFFRRHESHLYDTDWCSIVEFPHLISLDIDCVSTYYVEHFLNEIKTHLPHLTELKVNYQQLDLAIKNFTRDETRRNCAQVKQLIVKYPIIYTKDFCSYFPSLLI